MTSRSLLIAAALLILTAPAQAQTYGTAAISFVQPSSGVTIPGGIKTGNLVIFGGAAQSATVAPFCPTWVAMWHQGDDYPHISDGQDVNWSLDIPQGPGHYHCEYVGTVHETWNWFFWTYQYSISYEVTVTYQTP